MGGGNICALPDTNAQKLTLMNECPSTIGVRDWSKYIMRNQI